MADGKWITLHPQKIAIRGARDMAEVKALLVWIQGQINDIYADREAITPRYVSQAGLKVMEILKLLPMTNCKACGYAACMAYAAALRKGRFAWRIARRVGREVPGKAGQAPGLPGRLRLACPGRGIEAERFMVVRMGDFHEVHGGRRAMPVIAHHVAITLIDGHKAPGGCVDLGDTYPRLVKNGPESGFTFSKGRLRPAGVPGALRLPAAPAPLPGPAGPDYPS